MCDTFLALQPVTEDGAVIFGKNSDREANEAQALEYHPAREYRAGTRLQCTYIEIPQAPATRAVLLCRPFWMWGAEMGANAAGLVIGNEANPAFSIILDFAGAYFSSEDRIHQGGHAPTANGRLPSSPR